MSTENKVNEGQIQDFIQNVSTVANLNLSEERQKAQVKGAVRLINDANALSLYVSSRDFIHISPITVYRW